jgi:hypothetical protein
VNAFISKVASGNSVTDNQSNAPADVLASSATSGNTSTSQTSSESSTLSFSSSFSSSAEEKEEEKEEEKAQARPRLEEAGLTISRISPRALTCTRSTPVIAPQISSLEGRNTLHCSPAEEVAVAEMAGT